MNTTDRTMTLAEARRAVRAKYPLAFGWREFTVSDYVVKTDPGGRTLGRAYRATDAWIIAAREINARSSTTTKEKR